MGGCYADGALHVERGTRSRRALDKPGSRPALAAHAPPETPARGREGKMRGKNKGMGRDRGREPSNQTRAVKKGGGGRGEGTDGSGKVSGLEATRGGGGGTGRRNWQAGWGQCRMACVASSMWLSPAAAQCGHRRPARASRCHRPISSANQWEPVRSCASARRRARFGTISR